MVEFEHSMSFSFLHLKLWILLRFTPLLVFLVLLLVSLLGISYESVITINIRGRTFISMSDVCLQFFINLVIFQILTFGQISKMDMS